MPEDDGTDETGALRTELAKATTERDAATAELTTAQSAVATLTTSLTDLTREHLKSANPDLPDETFGGDDQASITAAVAAARKVADHVKAAAPQPPATPATPSGAGVTRQAEVAENVGRGFDRIKDAINAAARE